MVTTLLNCGSELDYSGTLTSCYNFLPHISNLTLRGLSELGIELLVQNVPL